MRWRVHSGYKYTHLCVLCVVRIVKCVLRILCVVILVCLLMRICQWRGGFCCNGSCNWVVFGVVFFECVCVCVYVGVYWE